MKNRKFLLILSLLLATFIISSSFVLAEDNSTNTCVEKTYMECGTSQGIPVSVNVRILANCDKESTVNEVCNNGCSNGICNPETTFKEQIKCVFDNSNEFQKCYTSDGKFGCSGTGTCVADVSGKKGTKLTWKSSCDGYATTIIDGENEYAQFTCASNPETPVIVKEQVKCIFDNSVDTQSCFAGDGKFVCSGVGSCVADVSGEKGKKLYWLSTCEGDAYTVIDGDNEYAEFKCVPPIVEPVIVKEQVKCVFKNAVTDQKCYTAEDNPRFYCMGTDTCVVDVNGKKGEKLTWKSTCGGYAYTITDGDNEYVEFNCVPEGNVTIESIGNKGFRYAYWQCYSGKEQKQGSESSCKSSEIWQSYAKEFCQDECYKDKSKCGVNSFSVTEECYTDFEKPIIEIGGASGIDCEGYLKECKTGNQILCDKWTVNCQIKPELNETTIEALICKDSCPLDGKCYPFGYRKSNNFCSDTGSFVEQLAGDKTCENNFECSSNVCVSNKCISPSLIDKILNWFKRLFGGE